ncbi:hypothetical protein K449DRAFT_13314 [Hypoxylon sp. EC38]|nr:hypothetical protein K449DRAFT_13314 [Hypoxylon sp. EC38]
MCWSSSSISPFSTVHHRLPAPRTCTLSDEFRGPDPHPCAISCICCSAPPTPPSQSMHFTFLSRTNITRYTRYSAAREHPNLPASETYVAPPIVGVVQVYPNRAPSICGVAYCSCF